MPVTQHRRAAGQAPEPSSCSGQLDRGARETYTRNLWFSFIMHTSWFSCSDQLVKSTASYYFTARSLWATI